MEQALFTSSEVKLWTEKNSWKYDYFLFLQKSDEQIYITDVPNCFLADRDRQRCQ